MDDLISRQAAIDALDGEITVTGSANAEAVRGYVRLVADRLKRLPSAQPERWIPCSERLPELDEAVLATTAWNDITIAWRIGICEWFIHEGNTNAETDDVIAWMPLPEPARLEETDG